MSTQITVINACKIISKICLVCIVLLLVGNSILVVFGLTSAGLEQIQKRVEVSSEEKWAADWQWRLSHIYYYTFRTKNAIRACEKFIANYDKDRRHSDARFKLACWRSEVWDVLGSISDFEGFIATYPNHPRIGEAQIRLIRLEKLKKYLDQIGELQNPEQMEKMSPDRLREIERKYSEDSE